MAGQRDGIEAWLGAEVGRVSGPARRALSVLLRNVPGFVYRARNTPSWPMDFVSARVVDVLGYEAEPITSGAISYGELIHPDDRAAVYDEVQCALAGDGAFHLVYRVRHAAGTYRWVAENGAFTDTDAKPELLEGVVFDISGERELREQLEHAQKAEAVGRLAGAVAHDVNNVLTVVRSYASILADVVPAEHRPDLEQIMAATDRGAAITAQLLAFSRKQPTEPRPIELGAVVRQAEPMLRRLLGEGVRLRLDLDPAAGFVHADPRQIEQVLMNLAVNAADAMEGSGECRIATLRTTEAPDGRDVMLTVSDTGCGMPDDVAARIFEPFFTTKGEGTGLGLAIVAGVVAQSGGSIGVHSEPGQGSAFHLRFPPTAPPRETAGPRDAAEAIGGDEVILLVEDEGALRRACARILKRYGYTVLEAESIEAARRILDGGERLDLIVTDWLLPDGRGAELVSERPAARSRLPVLAISGHLGFERDAPTEVATLAKPFSSEELARAVRRALDEDG